MAKQDELGAMWIKSGPRGEFMTGKINGVAIVAFRNDKKKNPKEPDWRILKSKHEDGSAPLAPQHRSSEMQTRADGRRNEQDLRAGRPEDDLEIQEENLPY